MFRSKVFSVLQNIVNRNSCNIKHINSFQYALFSTNPVSGDSAETSEGASNVTPESINTNSQHPDISPEISVEASVGTSLSNTSSTEYEPDKLYKKLEVEIRGNDCAVLKSYGQFAAKAAEHLEINIGRHIAAPRPIHNRLTVLRSVHVHKKHRVQYETRTYYRYLDFFNLTGSTADTFLEYIQRNLPEGVAMKVTKVELQPLPETVQQATALQ